MVYFVIYGFLLAAVLVGYIRTGVKLSLFNIYFGLFFLYYGPAFFIYNNELKLFETDYAIKTAIMLSIFIICYFLGRRIFLATKNTKALKMVNYEYWTSHTPDPVNINQGLLTMFVIGVAVVISAGLFLFGGITSLATAIRTPFADESVISSLRTVGGVKGWFAPYYTYITTGVARLTSFIFIGWAFQKKSKVFKFISIAFALFVSIAYLANLTKSGFVAYIGQLMFFLLLLFNVKINYKKVLLIIAIIVPMLIVVYLLATNSGTSSVALAQIGNRVFQEPIRVLELYPYYYPNLHPHTYGMNIRIFHDLFSETRYVPANIVVTGAEFDFRSFNAMFIGDAYVDFSYLGVIFQSIFVGYYISFLDVLVFRRNNYMKKALLASLLMGVFVLINAGLVVSMFAYGLCVLPVIAYWITSKKQLRPKKT